MATAQRRTRVRAIPSDTYLRDQNGAIITDQNGEPIQVVY
jgi:hypothetical protein